MVDDHTLVRIGIWRILDDFPDMDVVGEAENGEVALAMVKLQHHEVSVVV